MRHVASAVLTLLLFALPASAQPISGEGHFARTNHDFGVVPRGAQLLHKFTWTNGEKTRLEVADIRTTCGCATASPTPRVVEPGQQGAIEVVVDAKKFVGQKDIQLHVTLVGELKLVATLRVSAHCRPDVVYNPGEVNFGVVPPDAGASQSIEIEYAGKLDWRIEELVNTHPQLEASLEELYRKPGEVGYRIKVILKPGAPAGDLKHELQLKINDPTLKVIPVLVQGTIRAPLSAMPAVAAFGSVRAGRATTRRVVLRAERPFLVTEIEGLPAGVSVAKPTKPALVQTLVLTWTPVGSTELNSQVLIRTDLDEKAVLSLPLLGQIGP